MSVNQAGIRWTGSLGIASWVPCDYGSIISIGVRTKVTQEISNQSKHKANERYQDGQSPFWKGFFGHLRNKGPNHQFLNFCKGKFPRHRSKQSKEKSDSQVSQKHPCILQVGPVHRIILEDMN